MQRFTPPTTTYPLGREGTLWGRMKGRRGIAVVLYTNGRVASADVAPSASEDGVLTVWPGGRTYDITDAEAAILTEAGYGSCLESS